MYLSALPEKNGGSNPLKGKRNPGRNAMENGDFLKTRKTARWVY